MRFARIGWTHSCRQTNPTRRLVYRRIESLMQLNNAAPLQRSLALLYGAESVCQAQALLDSNERFFGLMTLGSGMEGSAMHRTLLAAYDKLFVGTPDAVPAKS